MPARSLYVLRHAKSSWDEPMQSDHDRPLASRGRRALDTLTEHISGHGIAPDLILCSTARRARDTLAGLPLDPATARFEAALYSAHACNLIDRLAALPSEVGSVMVVGHNPALQMLILRLAAGPDPRLSAPRPPTESLVEIARKFPTGALATLELDGDWAEIGMLRAALADYVRPKALQYS